MHVIMPINGVRHSVGCAAAGGEIPGKATGVVGEVCGACPPCWSTQSGFRSACGRASDGCTVAAATAKAKKNRATRSKDAMAFSVGTGEVQEDADDYCRTG
jgi:hypothetical protein